MIGNGEARGAALAILRAVRAGRRFEPALDAAPRSLDGLGMAREDLVALRRLVARGEGVVLAAGPTGSGKSTTLFAALAGTAACLGSHVALCRTLRNRKPKA